MSSSKRDQQRRGADLWSPPYPLSNELRTQYSSDFKHIAMAVNWSSHLVTLGDKKFQGNRRFFVSESFLTVSLAFMLALLLAEFTMPFFNYVSNIDGFCLK